ncbi:ABC-three component system protein [Aliarcobacter vitoriensis]|uniref:ABC-three component system protein n=1 Tax=Aliarcobacter vitoriensis TaxID=2011099 RepID=UPI003AAD8B5D
MPKYFDATFSWSGYSYQGKVGIFVTLKELNKYTDNNIETFFNDWSLEFEWLEDFSIRQGRIYKSLHQVKTLKSRNIDSYTKAINQILENAWSEYTYYIKPYFHVSSNVNNPHNIFYQYTIDNTNKKYCPLDKIDNLLKDEVKLFLQRHNVPDYNGHSEDLHFFKLLSIIDNHVKRRHQNIQRVGRNTFPEQLEFITIINSLKTDSRQFTNERMIYEKKAYFSLVLDKFLQNKNDDTVNKLKLFARESFDLDSDFVKYSKSISPHILAIYDNEITIVNFQDILNAESLKGVFFKIVEQVDSNYLWQGHKVIYEKIIEEENRKFLPTTINRDQDDCDEVSADILTNPYAIEDLYEMDYFITGRINCESIEEEANNYTEIRDEDLPNVENKEYKINELKKVQMIDRISAERILND